MTDQTTRAPRPACQTLLPKAHSPALQPLFQSLLATLAHMDVAYDCERDRLSECLPDPTIRRIALARLERRHRDLRAPYLRRLARLEDRMQQGWH